jgi:LacI family transcriptional regulator/LacI family repressor for deo operon, udp, cdd, tsx, nupC, and nupG
MSEVRVTQMEIARAARVHRTTVSLALADNPRIPAKTKARIKRIAEKLGYTPDPMLSALIAYRTKRRPVAFHGTLAWLANTEFGYDWKLVPHYRDYYEGAAARARACGFQLEAFDFNTPAMQPRRIAGILRARNITGVLLCPQPLEKLKDKFAWEEFSVVTFGYTLAELGVHTVTAAHYRAMRRIMSELHARGYRRIGFSFAQSLVERDDHNVLAGFLVAEGLLHRSPAVPPLFGPSRSAQVVGQWLERYRPDAIVSGNHLILDLLRELKIRVPHDLGAACPFLPSEDTELAGVVEDSKRIGAIAVDHVVSMINRGERGIPGHPLRIHVEGAWRPGKSLRPVPRG